MHLSFVPEGNSKGLTLEDWPGPLEGQTGGSASALDPCSVS